jgi:hypothetical protein
VVLPAPDPTKTTRERYFQHSTDSFCKGCHLLMDPIGFTFENFDAVGRARATDAGKPVDTSGSIYLDGEEQSVRDSVELSVALSGSREMRECAARQVARFASGRTDREAELAFSEEVERRGADGDSLLSLFLTYVESEAFVWRKQ